MCCCALPASTALPCISYLITLVRQYPQHQCGAPSLARFLFWRAGALPLSAAPTARVPAGIAHLTRLGITYTLSPYPFWLKVSFCGLWEIEVCCSTPTCTTSTASSSPAMCCCALPHLDRFALHLLPHHAGAPISPTSMLRSFARAFSILARCSLNSAPGRYPACLARGDKCLECSVDAKAYTYMQNCLIFLKIYKITQNNLQT